MGEYFNKKMKSSADLIFGTRALIEAIKAGQTIDKVLIKVGTANASELNREMMGYLKDYKIPYQHVPIEKLNRVTNKNHQGVIAYISPIPFHEVENIVPSLYEAGKSPLLLVLDRITDVRNFGAICRSASCMGVDAVIIPARGGAQINSDAVKTSAGALMSLPICKTFNLKETLEFLKNSGIRLVSITEKTDNILANCDFSVPSALIMGSEEDGISEEFIEMSDARCKIPISGAIESLNVSVAAGIALYEVARQRG